MPDELDELPPSSLAARDFAQQQSVSDLDAMLRQAVAQSGRSPLQIRSEIRQARKWPGKVTTLDYLTYRLYEKNKSERREFISDWVHWPIHEICEDPVLSPITVDKWRCTETLIEAGIPTVPILGVVDPTGGTYGATRRVTTSAELLDFLRSTSLPVFAKPNSLLGSFGAFRIDDHDDVALTINEHERVLVDSALDELMAGIPYVIQPVVENHLAIAPIASGLATVRTVNLVSPGEVRIAAAVFKIPTAGNIADNFWRSGNLLADVDPETGALRRVVQGSGPGQVEHDDHPETGARLVGLELPWWSDVIRLNQQTAERFGSISYQSQDITLTADGPVVVEVNSGSSFALPQIASGRGFLTEENKRFFESCGVNFRRLPEPLAK